MHANITNPMAIDHNIFRRNEPPNAGAFWAVTLNIAEDSNKIALTFTDLDMLDDFLSKMQAMRDEMAVSTHTTM